MRAVVQRVLSASVSIDSAVISSIDRGLVVLLGVQSGDLDADADWLAGKIASLRIFADPGGKMNLSLVDLRDAAAAPERDGFNALVVSQFTLIASLRKGCRPSFHDAARPEVAVPRYERFVHSLESALHCKVATGRFGADMKLTLVNDGPVTLILDSQNQDQAAGSGDPA